jgi:uncharacterized membrane protein YqjE
VTQDDRSGTAPEREPGTIAAARRLGASLVDVLQTRLELLSTELEEEALQVRRLLRYGLLSLLFLSAGFLLLTGFILVLFWDEHRLLALGLCAALYLALGAAFALTARGGWRRKPRFLSATLAELRKDGRRLKP